MSRGKIRRDTDAPKTGKGGFVKRVIAMKIRTKNRKKSSFFAVFAVGNYFIDLCSVLW